MGRRIAFVTVIGALVLSCGGTPAVVPTSEPVVDEAEQAISIIRRSFDAMGSLERLRLAGSKVSIMATVTVGGESFPVSIKMGGPERYRIDYVNNGIAYVYVEGTCRKTAYGVSAHCTPKEASWVTPIRILVGLTFPAGDAANLRSNFRMRDPISVDGRPCSVAEVRPKNTNYRIRAAYDDTTGLLAQVNFAVRDEQGGKDRWQVTYSDWRTVKKMQVPFKRIVSYQGQVVWTEVASEVRFDGVDDSDFLAPVAPTTDQALPASLPARRIVRSQIGDQAVEIPAPYPTVGGGAPTTDAVELVAAAETIRIVHRGPVSKANAQFEKLTGGALAAGRTTSGNPSVILLEEPQAPDEPALIILYVPLAPEGVGVKIEGIP